MIPGARGTIEVPPSDTHVAGSGFVTTFSKAISMFTIILAPLHSGQEMLLWRLYTSRNDLQFAGARVVPGQGLRTQTHAVGKLTVEYVDGGHHCVKSCLIREVLTSRSIIRTRRELSAREQSAADLAAPKPRILSTPVSAEIARTLTMVIQAQLTTRADSFSILEGNGS